MSHKIDKGAAVSPSTTHVPDAETCRTSPLVAGFSICLNKVRFCPHALSFGHQYLCRHPEHARFIVKTPQKAPGEE